MTASSSEHPISSRQARMREKAEEINLLLLEPDVDLWKLRELALSEGGLVNDTIRRRAWPKLVGLTSYHGDETEPKTTTASTTRTTSPRTKAGGRGITPRKGTAPTRVTNFGSNADVMPSTAFTGGPFDQHDTVAATAPTEDDNSSLGSEDSANKKSNITECQDAEQIERDVTRCTWHLLTGGQRSRRRIMVNKHRKKVAKVLRRKQRRLGDLINLTLAQSEVDLPDESRLCYYQGYHDVASIFLAALGGASTTAIQQQKEAGSRLVGPSADDTAERNDIAAQASSMGLELSSRVLYQISLSHFREPMRNNFLQLQTTLRLAFFPLLAVMDPELHAHLYGCGMEPFFALSWVITWFSHDIRDTTLVKRLFDVFLVSHPLMPIYLSVAMCCHPNNRQEVLATPCEFAELHSTLAGLPKNSSMVGWKYRVGDGYVSDDEEVGEDGETSISLDSDMASHLSNDRSSNRGGGGGQTSLLSGRDGGMGRDNLVLSEGHAHVVSMGIPAHVPFQDLIDLAINFMRRVPPRKLSAIAERYYGPEQSEPMLKMYPEISFFHAPPAWALAKSAKADWVLKQRARESLGMSSKSRKDRRVLSELRNRNNTATTGEDTLSSKAANKHGTASHDKTGKLNDNTDEDNEDKYTPEMVEVTARQLKWPKAMIVQGFGPGEDEVAKRKRRRRLILIGSAVTVAVFAIALGASMKSQSKRNPRVQQERPVATSSNKSSTSKVSHAKSSLPGLKTNSKTGSKLVGSMKSAAKDFFADNETFKSCPAKASLTSVRGTPATASSNTSGMSRPASAVGAPIDTSVKESLIQSVIQKMILNHLKALAYQFQLLVKTIEANVKDPESRSNFQRRFSHHLKTASTYVADFTVKAFKFTRRQAREHLGGDSLEDLGLI